MSTQSYDWTQFTKQIYIEAAVDEVFRMWATPEGIVQWFIAEAEYHTPDGTLRAGDALVQSGDLYHWRWHQPLEMRGEVLEVIENECLRVTFGQSASGDQPIMVTVRFEAGDGETQVTLTQQNMADTPTDHAQWHLSCNLGWSFFMTNLKALLEYGADLREKTADRAYSARAVTN